MSRVLHSAALLFFVAALAFAQDVSERREIAIFALESRGYSIPEGALNLVDDQIKDVFSGLGRFDVVGMSYRLTTGSVNDFITKVREVKERDLVLPETVKLGQEAFTEADFNKLVGSFIVVIPSMNLFEVNRIEDGRYRCSIGSSFSFINVAQYRNISQFDIRTSGTGDSPQTAVRDAADDISRQLTFEIRSIPEFQIKSGIIDTMGSEAVIEFGANMGVRIGDEYAIVRPRILPSGYEIREETGLLIVKDVKDEISIAQIIYSAGKPRLGEQVEEIPRLGFDSSAYLHTVLDSGTPVVAIGVKQSTTRGFYGFHPFIGVELPIFLNAEGYSPGLLVNLLAGGDLNWYLWRFQFATAAAVGFGGGNLESDGDGFRVTHIGGRVQISASYLLTRDFKVFVDVGYAAWFGTNMVNESGTTFRDFC